MSDDGNEEILYPRFTGDKSETKPRRKRDEKGRFLNEKGGRKPGEEPGADRGDGKDVRGLFAKGNKAAVGSGGPKQSGGLKTAQRWLTKWGNRAIDGRSAIGKHLAEWKNSLIDELGGKDVVTVQQEEIADICTREKLLLDSVDRWLFEQPTLVRAQKGSLLPVLVERQKIADSLTKHLAMLGLERRKREKDTYTGFIAKLEKRQQEKAQEEEGE